MDGVTKLVVVALVAYGAGATVWALVAMWGTRKAKEILLVRTKRLDLAEDELARLKATLEAKEMTDVELRDDVRDLFGGA